jgi:hypothetical protein
VILVRGQGWGKFHVVDNPDDHVAVCGKQALSVGAFSHRLADGCEDLALSRGWICGHCLNRMAYREAQVRAA